MSVDMLQKEFGIEMEEVEQPEQQVSNIQNVQNALKFYYDK